MAHYLFPLLYLLLGNISFHDIYQYNNHDNLLTIEHMLKYNTSTNIIKKEDIINSDNTNNWCNDNILCNDSYRFARGIMPQYRNINTTSLSLEHISPENIIPFQGFINRTKVRNTKRFFIKLTNNKYPQLMMYNFYYENPLIVAKYYDTYRVIDGHHSWASLIEVNKLRSRFNSFKLKLLAYVSSYNDTMTWRKMLNNNFSFT